MCGDAEMLDAPPLMTRHDEYERNGERTCFAKVESTY